MVLCSLLGASLFEVEQAMETSGPWRWEATRALSACMGRQMNHFGSSHALGRHLPFSSGNVVPI
jgi:hypothetical protein